MRMGNGNCTNLMIQKKRPWAKSYQWKKTTITTNSSRPCWQNSIQCAINENIIRHTRHWQRPPEPGAGYHSHITKERGTRYSSEWYTGRPRATVSCEIYLQRSQFYFWKKRRYRSACYLPQGQFKKAV